MSRQFITTESETAELEQRMKATRSRLAEHVETLEDHVGGMVHDATASVSATIESVKETMGETVDTVQGTMTSVKRALDLHGHIRRHPWLMLAGAVALGYICGSFVLRHR